MPVRVADLPIEPYEVGRQRPDTRTTRLEGGAAKHGCCGWRKPHLRPWANPSGEKQELRRVLRSLDRTGKKKSNPSTVLTGGNRALRTQRSSQVSARWEVAAGAQSEWREPTGQQCWRRWLCPYCTRGRGPAARRSVPTGRSEPRRPPRHPALPSGRRARGSPSWRPPRFCRQSRLSASGAALRPG